MEWFASPEIWVALATLTALEIVLGIDNVIFISILVSRLPASQQRSARVIGLGLAMATRIMLLLSIAWIMRLQTPLFTLLAREVSGRDIILLAGGLFLLAKATLEIHHAVEAHPDERRTGVASYGSIIAQIAALDVVFSLDSVITAVGMVDHVPVMVAAIVIAVICMMIAAEPISQFVDDHPTIKMLALSFLVLIGVVLIAEGVGFHIPKGYIYFALTFSICVEMLNLRVRRRRDPVKLHKRVSA